MLRANDFARIPGPSPRCAASRPTYHARATSAALFDADRFERSTAAKPPKKLAENVDSPAPPPAPRPGFLTALARKTRAYGEVLLRRQGPEADEYRYGLIMVAANQLGDGLIDGAFHVLLDVLGVATHSLSIVCMVTMSLAQVCMGICGQAYSSVMRDEANELAQRPLMRPEGQKRARNALFNSALVDMACAGALLGCAIGVSFLSLSAGALFVGLTVVKCIQGINTSYEVGNWYCLRSHLGVDDAAMESKVLATMNFMEMAAGSGLLEVGKWATYMTALVLSWYSAPLFLWFSIGALIVGGLLTGVPKMCIKLLHRDAAPAQTPSAPDRATSPHHH